MGKAGDFVILSDNPLDIDSENLDIIEVLENWFDGKLANTSIYTWANFKLVIKTLIKYLFQ